MEQTFAIAALWVGALLNHRVTLETAANAEAVSWRRRTEPPGPLEEG